MMRIKILSSDSILICEEAGLCATCLRIEQRCYRRRSSLRTPLTAKAAAATSADMEGTKPGKNDEQACKDVEKANSSSDGEEVSPRLQSLFSPAARVKSVMDVSLAS